jgi:UDP-N-acetylmuramoyl-tripeptide--D-alanyl-D-alanine ligase
MNQRIFEEFLKSKKVTTDTRSIEQGSIFFALKGDRFNGNHFAQQALESGAALVVVDEDVDVTDTGKMVRVPNALEALQQLAAMYRNTWAIPVLAITGSNGKTTSKELIRDVLAQKFKVHATKGNLNNHIGVPLTILSAPEDAQLVILEMGANHQKEISSYCAYARPEFALVTNIGKAHLEGFGGVEGVVKGKKELYDFVAGMNGVLFINTELENLQRIGAEFQNKIEYGLHSGGQYLTAYEGEEKLRFKLTITGRNEVEVKTQLAGTYNLLNMASAIAVGRYFEVPLSAIVYALEQYVPDNNRSQLMKTQRNTLILDAYNANPSSMLEALLNLSKQRTENKWAILGDMLELGEDGPKEHLRVFELLKELNLSAILIGPLFQAVGAGSSFQCFASTEEARPFLVSNPPSNRLILLKGSRGIRLEGLLDLL